LWSSPHIKGLWWKEWLQMATEVYIHAILADNHLDQGVYQVTYALFDVVPCYDNALGGHDPSSQGHGEDRCQAKILSYALADER
jgi:hypothetical protein